MSFSLPEQVLRAFSLLEGAGYETYLVGGSVRDLLRGDQPSDFDMTTRARPEETLAVFSEYRTVETGLRHGTVTVLIDGMPIEITTYRVDGAYTDHRRPDSVTFTSSIREDLARRDLTVNAMAYHPLRGLFDPFGGERDLAAGVIRAVGDPERRFAEDALRILRTLRFAARFSFRIDRETAVAAAALAPTLSAVAPERIREELFRLLISSGVDTVLAEHGHILSKILPGLPLREPLSPLPPELPLRAAALLAPMGGEYAARLLRDLRTDNATARAILDTIAVLAEEPPREEKSLLGLLRDFGADAVDRAATIWEVHGAADGLSALLRAVLASGRPYTVSALAVTGEDLMTIGVPSGPKIGRLLRLLLDAVIGGEAENTKEALLSLAEAMM